MYIVIFVRLTDYTTMLFCNLRHGFYVSFRLRASVICKQFCAFLWLDACVCPLAGSAFDSGLTLENEY